MPASLSKLRVPPARQGPGPIPSALVDAFALSLARRGAGVFPGDRMAPGVGSGTELAQLRPYQLGDDVRDLAPDVLRHRLVLSYDALSDGVSSDDILSRLLATMSSGPAHSGVPAEAPSEYDAA